MFEIGLVLVKNSFDVEKKRSILSERSTKLTEQRRKRSEKEKEPNRLE